MRREIIALLTLGLMIVTWSFVGIHAKTEAPSLSVGDQWTYGWVDGSGEFLSTVTPRTEIVDRIEDFEGVPCCVLIRDIEVGPVYNKTKTVWMTSDWVILKTEDYEIYMHEHARMEQRITRIYSPGIRLYDFPLSVGKEWSGRSYVTHTVVCYEPGVGEETGSGSDWVDWIRKVISTETITVPAGTFDTYVIEEFRRGSGERFWFSVDARNHVKTEDLVEDPEEVEKDLMERFGVNVSLGGGEILTSYELAPRGNGSLNLPLIVALAAPIGVLGFTFIVYNRRRQGTRDW